MNRRLVSTFIVSFIFIYLFLYDPHLRALFAGNESPVTALFGHNRIHWAELWEALLQVRFVYLTIGGAVLIVSLGIRSYRWRLLLQPVKKISFRTVFALESIGYLLNNVLPFRLGELGRAYLMGEREEMSRVSVLATILVERILDMLGLLFLVGLTLLLYRFPAHTLNPAVTISLGVLFTLLLLLLLLAIIYREFTRRAARLVARLLPGHLAEKFNRAVSSFLDGLEVLRQTHHYLQIFVTTVSLWILYLIIILATLAAFSLFNRDYPLIWESPLVTALVVLTITSIGISIPSAPGAVGTYHAAAQFALSLFGVPSVISIPLAIVLHLLSYLLLNILGFYYFWTFQLSVREITSNI